jgi:polysaccharide export outer membrane protein
MNLKFLQVCARVFLLAAGVGVAVGQQKPESADRPASPPEQANADEPHSVSHPVPAERNPRYLLRPSDVLQISFPISPEFDQTVAVQPDGYISLRGVGDLHVAGESVPELTAALQKAYTQFMHEPVINVELKEFEKPYFIASGEFGHPGKYELRGDTTVTEAAAIAGGFTDKAKHSDVVLYRKGRSGWVASERLNVKQLLASRDLTEDPHLNPGDMIYVPKNALSKIRQFIPNPGVGFTIP